VGDIITSKEQVKLIMGKITTIMIDYDYLPIRCKFC